MSTRLDAFLSHRGFGSRSQSRDLVRRGRVSVDGVVCRNHGLHIDGRVIAVDRREVVAGPLSAVSGKPTSASVGLRPTTLVNEGGYMNFGLDR